MHPDVNILTAQSHIADTHRAAAVRRVRAEARRAAAEMRSAERSQLRPVAHASLFRRVVTRLAV